MIVRSLHQSTKSFLIFLLLKALLDWEVFLLLRLHEVARVGTHNPFDS